MIKRMDIAGRGFNKFELADEHKRWQATLIYDPDKLVEWGKKCLEILEKVKNLPKENNVRIHEFDPVSVCNFQCIDYGWNYRFVAGKGGSGLYTRGNKPVRVIENASFVSALWFYQLLDIFGLNANQELDITNPTPDQELEVCKAIMKDLWEEYKEHVL